MVFVYSTGCGCTQIERAFFYDELDDVIRVAPEDNYLTIEVISVVMYIKDHDRIVGLLIGSLF